MTYWTHLLAFQQPVSCLYLYHNHNHNYRHQKICLSSLIASVLFPEMMLAGFVRKCRLHPEIYSKKVKRLQEKEESMKQYERREKIEMVKLFTATILYQPVAIIDPEPPHRPVEKGKPNMLSLQPDPREENKNRAIRLYEQETAKVYAFSRLGLDVHCCMMW